MIRTVLLCGLANAACSLAASRPQDSRLSLSACADEESEKCGTLTVPLSTRVATTETLAIKLRVIPAQQRGSAKPPIFFLAGGPGQSIVDLAKYVAPIFVRIAPDRDLVFVEQRGTGKKPLLQCDDGRGQVPNLSTLLGGPDEFAKLMEQCRSTLNLDPAHFLTVDYVEDLDQVRQALGYTKITLLGVSYGTRVALAYLARHAEAVDSAILDAAAPLALNLATSPGIDGAKAISQTIAACEADAKCAQAFPNLSQRFAQYLTQLSTDPQAITVAHPWSGENQSAKIAAGQVPWVLFSNTYTGTQAALIPYALDALLKGDPRPLVGLSSMELSPAGLNLPLFATVACNEDFAHSPPNADDFSSANPFGQFWNNRMRTVCEKWPKAEVPREYYADFRVDVPMLVLSGEFDPITPPKWGELAAKFSSRSTHVILHDNGHGSLMVPCGQAIMRDFLAQSSETGLDTQCANDERRSPFWIDAFAP